MGVDPLYDPTPQPRYLLRRERELCEHPADSTGQRRAVRSGSRLSRAQVNSRSYPDSWPDLEATTRNVPCESTAEARLSIA
jgi:hypothetical protein